MKWINKNKASLVFVLIFSITTLISLFINLNYRYYQIIIELSEFGFWMSVSVLFFSVVSIFLKEDTSKSWRKFTYIFLPIAVALILITPNSSHGMDIYPIIKENVTIVLVSFFSLISLVLIAYKSIKSYG